MGTNSGLRITIERAKEREGEGGENEIMYV